MIVEYHSDQNKQKECTNKKGKKISLIYKEIQKGAVAKSKMRKGFLVYEEICKFLEEAVS